MNSKLGLLALLLVALIYLPLLSGAPPLQGLIVIEYGMSGCPYCVAQKAVLEGLWEEGKLYFVYVELMGNETNALEYSTLYTILVGDNLRVPFLVLLIDGEVKAVLVGYCNSTQLLGIAGNATKSTGILVVSGSGVREVVNDTTITEVQRIIGSRLKGVSPSVFLPPLTLRQALALLVPLAVASSMNPCTFTLYAALVATVLVGGRRKALTVALAFIVGVFVCYYLVGVGLVTATLSSPRILVKIFSVLGVALGVYSMVKSLRPGVKLPIPETVKRMLEIPQDLTTSAVYGVAGPLGATGLGVLFGLVFFPCSGAPYLVFTTILSRLSTHQVRYILLLLYNAIAVLPLIGVALVLILTGSATESVGRLRGPRVARA
ncbi:MAG: hypothetical protein QXY49_03365, partial [Thermofilaceae archaeon]